MTSLYCNAAFFKIGKTLMPYHDIIDILNLRLHLVSYHDIDIIPTCCPALGLPPKHPFSFH